MLHMVAYFTESQRHVYLQHTRFNEFSKWLWGAALNHYGIFIGSLAKLGHTLRDWCKRDYNSTANAPKLHLFCLRPSTNLWSKDWLFWSSCHFKLQYQHLITLLFQAPVLVTGIKSSQVTQHILWGFYSPFKPTQIHLRQVYGNAWAIWSSR